jgi:hypothetical protein
MRSDGLFILALASRVKKTNAIQQTRCALSHANA